MESKKKSHLENFTTDNPIQFYAATKKANEVMAYSYSKLYKIKHRFKILYCLWSLGQT